MNQFFKITALCAGLALFAAACNNLELPEPADSGQAFLFPADKANGLVLVSIGGEPQGAERTLLPTFPTTLKYMLTAEAQGKEPLSQPITIAGTVSMELTPAVWTFTVKAYAGEPSPESLTLEGSASHTVVAGKTAPLAIALLPVKSVAADEAAGIEGIERAGTFSYDITFPGDVQYAVLNVFPVDGGDAVKAIDLRVGAQTVAAGKKASGSVSIPADYYRVTVRFNRLNGTNQTYAGKTEALHIYKGLTTSAVYTFATADFSGTIPSGTGNRTFTNILGGEPATLQQAIKNLPLNTRDTPYVIAIKSIKINNTETVANKKLGSTEDPLANLFNTLEGRYVSYDLSGCTEAVIPDVSAVSYAEARSNKDRLISVILPSQLTTIGKFAFSNSSSLTEIVIPENVSEIKQGAFRYCSSLVAIHLPNSLTTLGTTVFSNCSSLTMIDIPAGVSNLGSNVFQNTDKLDTIILRKSDGIVTVNANTLAGHGSKPNFRVYVPASLVDSYKTAAIWTDLENKDTIIKAIPPGM